MFKSKKGQHPSGSNAAVLVAVLTLSIVLYVLFLPPQDREDLLKDGTSNGNDNNGNNNHEGSTLINGSFLAVHPGTMDVLESTEIEHNIPSFSLSSKTTPTVLKKVDSLSVANSWFTTKTYTTSFDVADLENTNNPIISFNIKQGRGILTIDLNGREIYSGINQGTLTIPIETGVLSDHNNLTFSASSVGVKFWATNEYVIEGLRLVADVLDMDSLTSQSIFMITSTEKSNIESAYLRFYLDCISDEKGRMDVLVNSNSIFSSGVNCGSPQKIDLAPAKLHSGENTITFKADTGAYLLDQIVVKTALKEIVYPTYFFKIGSGDFELISDNDKNVNLIIEFTDDVDYKKASIYVNGNELHLDQRELNYTKVLNAYLKEGDNAIELIPKTRLNVLTLKAEFVDNDN